MAHPAPYIPEDFLRRYSGLVVVGKELITPKGELTPLGDSVYWTIVSTVFFTLLYKLSRYYTPLYFKGYRQLSRHDQRDWDTRAGNILYPVYIVYWACQLVFFDQRPWASGPVPVVHRTSPDTYAALGVSTGFFIHEMFVTLKYWMGGFPMVVHHLGSTLCVVAAIAAGDGHTFTLWMLSTEFTTPFIAARFLLDKAGFRTHPLYVINGLLILASWTVARIATFPPFFLAVWRVRHEVPLMNHLSQFLLLVFPATLASLNVFWYMKIVRGAIKVLGPQKPGKQD